MTSSTLRKLQALTRLWLRPGTDGEGRAAYAAIIRLAQAKGVRRAELKAIRAQVSGITAAQDKAVKTHPAPWRKPKTAAGFEFRQCYKRTCHCMRGGRWHGPYRYAKKRRPKTRSVWSIYRGKV